MKTIKGPAIFLAQFAGNDKPFNNLRNICEWAKSLGCKVIGTVGSDEKINIARENGYDHVINYSKENFAKKVLKELISLGIFVRMPFVSPQDRCVRVSVGKKRDLDRFEKALPTALARASK